jgi:hypothetical protein
VRSLAAFTLKGRTQAAIATLGVMALSLVVPPAGLVSLALIALVTLRKGGWEGLALVALAALFSAVLGSLTVGNPWAAAVYAVALWLPMWGVALVLRERISLALAVQAAVLLGIVAVLGFFAWKEQPGLFWENFLNALFRPMLENAPTPAEAAQLQGYLVQWSEYMTGIVAAGLSLTLIMALFLARWWQAELFNPGGFGKEYLAIRSPRLLSLLTVGLLAAAVWGGEEVGRLCRNVVVVLTVLYLCIGTATLHSLCANVRWRRWLLVLLYAVVFVVPQAILPVALFGLADSWADWRRLKQSRVA